MKSFLTVLLLAFIALVQSEPPVSNEYLPPQNVPSTSYGVPQQDSYSRGGGGRGGNGGFGGGGGGGAVAPSTSYGAPAITSAIFSKPSSSYGAPLNQRNGGGYSNGGGGYSNGGGSYSNGGGGYSNGGGRNGNGGGYSYGGGNGGGDENYGPAKYEFQYDVQDYQSGNDFGHMESRDGDRTVGRYYVLLPDGRKQIVNYEADENGYRPTITYEQTNNGGYNGGGSQGGGGYDRNAQPTFNGYK